jgi:hypothetical protein
MDATSNKAAAPNALLFARKQFLAAREGDESRADLHAVIVEGPKLDHPRLHVGAPLPLLPVNLRLRQPIDSFFVDLMPCARIYYFGNPDRLEAFRDASRVALAAMRDYHDAFDVIVRKVLYAGPPESSDHVLAELPLLLMRNILAETAPIRGRWLDRWIWGESGATLRVPYYEDERQIWRDASPNVSVPIDAPNVTTFTHDVFLTAAGALESLACISPSVGPKLSNGPPSGAADERATLETTSRSSESRPSWIKKKRELEYRGKVLKVRDKSTDQIKLLDAFHKGGWHQSVVNPFESDRGLQQAIRSLSQKLNESEVPITVCRDNSRACWKERSESPR